MQTWCRAAFGNRKRTTAWRWQALDGVFAVHKSLINGLAQKALSRGTENAPRCSLFAQFNTLRSTLPAQATVTKAANQANRLPKCEKSVVRLLSLFESVPQEPPDMPQRDPKCSCRNPTFRLPQARGHTQYSNIQAFARGSPPLIFSHARCVLLPEPFVPTFTQKGDVKTSRLKPNPQPSTYTHLDRPQWMHLAIWCSQLQTCCGVSAS